MVCSSLKSPPVLPTNVYNLLHEGLHGRLSSSLPSQTKAPAPQEQDLQTLSMEQSSTVSCHKHLKQLAPPSLQTENNLQDRQRAAHCKLKAPSDASLEGTGRGATQRTRGLFSTSPSSKLLACTEHQQLPSAHPHSAPAPGCTLSHFLLRAALPPQKKNPNVASSGP